MDYQFITEPFQKGQYHAGAVVRDGYVAFWRYAPREDAWFSVANSIVYIVRPGNACWHLRAYSFPDGWSLEWSQEFSAPFGVTEKSLALFRDVSEELDARMSDLALEEKEG